MKITTKYILFTFSLLTFSLLASAQTLRGTVRDADSGRPVAGATVNLLGVETPAYAISDSAGNFVFENLKPGYYRLEIQAESFENQMVAEVNVASGKERALEVLLNRSATALPELTVTSNAPACLVTPTRTPSSPAIPCFPAAAVAISA